MGMVKGTVMFLFKMVEQLLRPWSKLPMALVGKLATVLREMGLHMFALQLQPRHLCFMTCSCLVTLCT